MKGLLKYLKSPRFISLIILFFTSITILSTLVIVSSRQKTQTPPEQDIEIATPIPQKTPKPVNEKIQSELDKYSQKVGNLKSKSSDFKPPSSDLNISF